MFGLCELIGMDIASLRKELGLSLEAFGQELGLSSKGQVSQIERGDIGCSVNVALQIERLSAGRISAAALNPKVALVDAARSAA